MSGRVTVHSEATTTGEHGIPSIRVLREGKLRHPSVFAKRGCEKLHGILCECRSPKVPSHMNIAP
jgi:hypothetical protein